MSKNELLANYRKAYVTIKTFPFIYTAALLIVSPLEAWLSLRWAELIGLFIFTSVPSVWLCWRLSKAVKLCPWHRAQCFIILLPLAIPFCRILLPQLEVVWVWMGISVVLIASLVNTYFVFVKQSIKTKNIHNNV